jgi:hypothetical protein
MDTVAVGTATTDWIIAVATALGAPVAAVGLLVAAVQLRGQRRATEAQFTLALDEKFQLHDKTHKKFRPAPRDEASAIGIWWGPSAEGPTTAEDWADVEAYMGLFERVNRMIDDGLITVKTFKSLYGYRVANILSNPRVVEEKLIKRGEYWKDFASLARRTGYDVPSQRDVRPTA